MVTHTAVVYPFPNTSACGKGVEYKTLPLEFSQGLDPRAHELHISVEEQEVHGIATCTDPVRLHAANFFRQTSCDDSPR